MWLSGVGHLPKQPGLLATTAASTAGGIGEDRLAIPDDDVVHPNPHPHTGAGPGGRGKGSDGSEARLNGGPGALNFFLKGTGSSPGGKGKGAKGYVGGPPPVAWARLLGARLSGVPT